MRLVRNGMKADFSLALLGCPWQLVTIYLVSWFIPYLRDSQPTYTGSYNPFANCHGHPSSTILSKEKTTKPKPWG